MDQNTTYLAIAAVVLLVIVLVIVNRRKAQPRQDLGTRSQQEGSDEARLAHLADLRSKGLVTEQEFEAQRRQILAKL